MTVSLYLAPAGSGKTQFAIDLIRNASGDLRACPRACVANQQQLVSWQRRLAGEHGCIGVHVQTFDELFASCLLEAGVAYTLIDDVVQFRLLSAVIRTLRLKHFASVQAMPGFIQEIRRIIGELKSALITPDIFLKAVKEMGDTSRLNEIGQIYHQYQRQLEQHSLTDNRGLGWLASRAVEEGGAAVGQQWQLLVLDGFASFTQTQLAFLRALTPNVADIAITLTGDAQAHRPRTVHRHFDRTRRQIESFLGLQAQGLAEDAAARDGLSRATGLVYLERQLFGTGDVESVAPSSAVTFMLATNHVAEVRVALRWLKERIVLDRIQPQDAALTARDIEVYWPSIAQVADEYQLPISFVEGLPLDRNPCIVAILGLLRMLRTDPEQTDDLKPILPRRDLLSALRSPYFDWRVMQEGREEGSSSARENDFLTEDDVEQLDGIGRWGRVISGPDQWWEVLDRLATLPQRPDETGTPDNERDSTPHHLPRGETASRIKRNLQWIFTVLRPPDGLQSRETFVRWLDRLLGPYAPEEPQSSARGTLNLARCVQKAVPSIRRRDMAALRAFKNTLRGILWAERAGFTPDALTYSQFLDDLSGALKAARFHPERKWARNAILVSNAIEARGVPCRALAVLGMGEGIFPASLTEDPFLNEEDRATLRDDHSLALDSSIESFEQQYFYETLGRPWERLLVTRPTQAEGGVLWEPSPFWTELNNIVSIGEARGFSASRQLPAASRAELVERLAGVKASEGLRAWEQPWLLEHWRHVEEAASIFRARFASAPSPFDGQLTSSAGLLRDRFGPDYRWSVSRLESHRSCPLLFFLTKVLELEQRPEPQEGLDARQLGKIYHRIFEETYERLPRAQRMDPERLHTSLEAALERILSEAPEREGFREANWWSVTQGEIRRNARQSLAALIEQSDRFVPTHFELYFGGSKRLTVERQGDRFFLHGIIDRVDVDEEGNVRLIDYKTAGPYGYDRVAHRDGKRLQLPLYALAAEQALDLGKVVDGYYWHVQHAERSRFTLKEAGTKEVMDNAVSHAWNTIEAIRGGHFAPEPPDGGCPDYCPGAVFCWRYSPRQAY